MNDALGDRMKEYERHETERRFLRGLPIYVRIDGKGFSRFTKDMERPFDEAMHECMCVTTEYLVKQTNALIGYTQSDEISLVLYTDNPDGEILFDSKVTKLTSVLAGMATARFTKAARIMWPELVDQMLPCFDARVFQVPNKIEATNAILWRELDATKNAISMAARHYFSHKSLHEKSGAEMQEMLFQEHGINFNDYPSRFKRGTFIRRELHEVELSGEELERIPEKHRPVAGAMPLLVQRHRMVRMDMPKFSTVKNRVEVIFNGEHPNTEAA